MDKLSKSNRFWFVCAAAARPASPLKIDFKSGLDFRGLTFASSRSPSLAKTKMGKMIVKIKIGKIMAKLKKTSFWFPAIF